MSSHLVRRSRERETIIFVSKLLIYTQGKNKDTNMRKSTGRDDDEFTDIN